jgi:hypothetical protein
VTPPKKKQKQKQNKKPKVQNLMVAGQAGPGKVNKGHKAGEHVHRLTR